MKYLFALFVFSTCAFAEPDPDVVIDRNDANQDRIDDNNSRMESFCSEEEKDEIEELTSGICREKKDAFAKKEGIECELTSIQAGLCKATCTNGSRTKAKLKIRTTWSCGRTVRVGFRKLIIIRY